MRDEPTDNYYNQMLAGEHGVPALDVARELKSAIEEIDWLKGELARWKNEADDRMNRMTLIMEEKTAVTERCARLCHALTAAGGIIAEGLAG
jgi:hypothetical protein